MSNAGMIVSCVESLAARETEGANGLKLPYDDKEIDFTPPWQRKTYAELFEQYVGVSMSDEAAFRRLAEQQGFPNTGKHPDVVVQHLLEEHVEKNLIGPVFVKDYPASL